MTYSKHGMLSAGIEPTGMILYTIPLSQNVAVSRCLTLLFIKKVSEILKIQHLDVWKYVYGPGSDEKKSVYPTRRKFYQINLSVF